MADTGNIPPLVKNTMRLFWNYLKKYKKLLIASILLATINQVFSLLDPQIFRLIVDNYASRFHELSRNEFIQGVTVLLAASVGVALISRIAKNFQDYTVNVVAQRVGASMYAQSVEHSFSLPYAVFEDQRSGELLQKLQRARLAAQALLMSLINVVFLSVIGILFVLVYAFFVHWLIGLVFALIIPVLGTITFLISRKIKSAQKKIVDETASLAGSTTETIRNVEVVKSLGLESQEIDRLNAINDYILSLEIKKVVLVRKMSFVQGTLINLMRSTLLLLMLWLIFQQSITLGEFFSIFVYSFFIFSPLYELGTVATQYQEAKASSEQLEEVFAIPPEKRPEHPVDISPLTSIEFSDVDFQYQSGTTAAVSKISLQIRAGETVAFVGQSGSGKTTMIKLIAGLYAPTRGKVLLNNHDSVNVDFQKLRNRLGLVSQETQLFAGTIRENLLFVKPEATDDEIRSALNAAAASSILMRSSDELNTKIGEGGIKLSGGERQRLAIARALLRNPDLIVFDEATSSLDSITEQAITKTIQDIEHVKPELITILVAHRLSTIAHADRIYVLEKGAIIETGTHETLTQQGGLYAALWRQQLGSEKTVS